MILRRSTLKTQILFFLTRQLLFYTYCFIYHFLKISCQLSRENQDLDFFQTLSLPLQKYNLTLLLHIHMLYTQCVVHAGSSFEFKHTFASLSLKTHHKLLEGNGVCLSQ